MLSQWPFNFFVFFLVGIQWHTNVQIDQNLITRGDMPRFVMDSYEECHGPPRLFTLDKYLFANPALD